MRLDCRLRLLDCRRDGLEKRPSGRFFSAHRRDGVFHNGPTMVVTPRQCCADRTMGLKHPGGRGVWAAFVSLLAVSAGLSVTDRAQAATEPVVYRCPGPPVLYTDALTPAQARSGQCRALTDLPVAQAQPSRAKSEPVPRDGEARRILEAELRREETRLQDARRRWDAAKPEDRKDSDSAEIRRAESDIEAIRRELARLR
ncbi:MAG: hypothetical protein RIR43_1621 [Pseudomonadota bacterium]